MNQSVWRSGLGRTRGSPASTTSCWPCSPPSSASPWRAGPLSCTGWGNQLLVGFQFGIFCNIGPISPIAFISCFLVFCWNFAWLCSVPFLTRSWLMYLQLWPRNKELQKCHKLSLSLLNFRFSLKRRIFLFWVIHFCWKLILNRFSLSTLVEVWFWTFWSM